MAEQQEPYDLNFCFPVPPVLESAGVKLVPFVPSTHGKQFHSLCVQHPSVFTYLPFNSFSTLGETVGWVEEFIRKDSGRVLFAIYDKTKRVEEASGEGQGAKEDIHPLAGVLAYINTSALNLCTEIGAVIIFPPFQRTHVARQAVGLLIQYGLELPSSADFGEGQGGLGLRRLVWQANALNSASVRLAQRMGFTLEGILRWDRALPPGKEIAANSAGLGIRQGDPKPGWVGRDTAMLGLCWDDWEGGKREVVKGIMDGTK